MRLFLLIILSFNLQAGVTLKELNYKLYFKWVTPELEEIVEAYQKLFTKVDESFEEEMRYIPWRGNLYYQYRSLINSCESEEVDISKCSEKIRGFKVDLAPFHTYWDQKLKASTNEFHKELLQTLTTDIKEFLDIKVFTNVKDGKASYPRIQKLISLYTLPYPYLISKIESAPIKEGVERLWGNFIEPIISKLLYRYNLDYLSKHIDRMNLQVNETRMIWMKRNPVATKLQKSINYMHYKWNIMLKSILKF